MADFCLISRRLLDEEEHRMFRIHFLLGADWRLCTRQLNMYRGSFFHSIYRIQQKLGRAFAELEPYGLYPVDEYFGVRIGAKAPSSAPLLSPKKGKRRPLVLPISA